MGGPGFGGPKFGRKRKEEGSSNFPPFFNKIYESMKENELAENSSPGGKQNLTSSEESSGR